MILREPVPKTPGVYALSHPQTKSLYIGYTTNLRMRGLNWRHSLDLKRDPRWPAGPSSDWTFQVLKETGDLPRSITRRMELEAIDRARSKGLNVLNQRKWHLAPSHLAPLEVTQTQETPAT